MVKDAKTVEHLQMAAVKGDSHTDVADDIVWYVF